MIKVYSTSENKFLKPIDKSEAELNGFISSKWKQFFPHFTFIKSEFILEGNVRSKGGSGRIDILAFNPESKKFIVFELKKESDKNIRNQASDYRDFIEDNFARIYLIATQKYGIALPPYHDIADESIELIMIAKAFSVTDIEKARRSKKNEITLIKYLWFEDELLLIDYLNNDPEDKIEKENQEKIKKIKAIIDNKSGIADVEAFLYGKVEAQRLFMIFYEYLNRIGDPIVEVQATKIKLQFEGQKFSIIGYAGKTGRKCFLVINTNIDKVKTELSSIVDDRLRPDGSKKGSIGSERYEVFIKTESELMKFLNLIEDASKS